MNESSATLTDEEILSHHDTSVIPRARMEIKLVRSVIRNLRTQGYSLTIDDGEELTPIEDEGTALLLIFNLDDVVLRVRKPGQRPSFVRFVFGNSGYDSICDYGMSLESALAESLALADQLESEA